jgi:AraC-like DNA-binding protein
LTDIPIISPGDRLDKRVEKIIEMMREDVRGELSLSEFAHSVNLSVWRLCHIFKTDVGMPPMRYLRLLRMERAKQLLESSFLSVKEVGYRVGLNDESHFVRDFKSTYGSSPACYRSHFRNNGGAQSHNGDSHNGNSGNGDAQPVNTDSRNGEAKPARGNQPAQLGQQLIRAAKQSILPTIHLFVCVMSTF